MLRSFSAFVMPFTLGLVLTAALQTAAQAGKVKVWDHHTSSSQDKAVFKHAVVSSEGVLRLSRQLRPLANVEAAHVWDVVEDRNGNLFVATGDEGKIFKITPDGKAAIAYTGEETEIFCLALGDDGTVYAGTGPHGQIIALKPDGTTSIFAKTSEQYVWSLTLERTSGKLMAGTGPHGRIYQITPDGKASIFYQTHQDHILVVAAGPDGMLYAGTDKNGLVYRIDARGKGFVLYNAPQTEIRSLLVTPNGLYAGTCSPGRSRVASSSGDRSYGSSGVHGRTVSLSKESADKSAVSTHHGHLSESHGNDRSGTAPAAGAPGYGENSLYHIALDGTVREVFRDKTLVLSLLREHGRLFVGTGMQGQLFEVNERSKEKSEIARLENGQIHSLYRRHDGSIIVGTGDPGKLYTLHDRYTDSGTVTSEVLDARMISRWGALRWEASTPTGTSVSLSVRSGNVADPDETWSDWSAEQTDPTQAVVTAPTARFLQYRVTLRTEDASVTPALHGLTIRYMPTNQAPEVTNVDVPNLKTTTAERAKKMKFSWNASDPNDDDLTYNLFIRKNGWKNWIKVAEDLEKKEYEWDTTTVPSGTYRLKVVASDRKDNSAEDALSASRVSTPFIVAHQPPAVAVKVVGMEGEQAVVEATATDPLVRLTAASFAVNSKKWVNVFPSDGLFDRKTSRFRFKTAALRPGSYVLVLRVTDAAGNTGSGDAVFTVKSR